MTDGSPTLPPPKRSGINDLMRKVSAVVITLLLVVFAALLTSEVWYLYMRAAWTRDAFVRVQVTDVAAEGVSGYVSGVAVKENQRVKKGDLLLTIDPTRYEIAMVEAQAILEIAQAEYELQQSFAQARVLAGKAVSAEDRQQYLTNAKTAKFKIQKAKASLDLAEFNIFRTKIFATTDGYVANLNLRVGDYAASSETLMIVLNEDTFWVEAYFEETKLLGIKVGDKAAIDLMAYDKPLSGEVISFSRGIANPNNNPGYLGLQQVNPIFDWVRLAQRIPVYVKIDTIPDGMHLIAGMTASVAVGKVAEETLKPQNLLDRLLKWFVFYL